MSQLFIILVLFLTLKQITSQTFLDLIRETIELKNNVRASVSTKTKYDFIVVGSGSAGSAVANRLSENTRWNVLLLEAGEVPGPLNQVPAIVASFQLSSLDWGYKVEPQQNACLGMINRQCPWPRGKSLGGTSVLNYMIHARGNREDYDLWARMGNTGWSYDELLPYFRKSERFRVPGVVNSSFHGTDGYVNVESIPYRSSLARAYLQAGRQLGYNLVDYNGENQIGFSYLQVTMDKGSRCSAAKAYLRVKRPNLDIVTGARVTRVLISSTKRAIGVEYIKNNKTYKVDCSKEVILSAGTIDSPKILMLSGIGPRDHLEQLGIVTIKDAKVGYNLVDHIGFLGLKFLVNTTSSLLPTRVFNPSNVVQYLANRSGPISTPGGAEALAFIKTKYAQDSRPDVELVIVSAGIDSDSGLFLKRVLGITDKVYNTVYKPLEGRDSWTILPIAQHPRSVGRLKLRSKNPFDDPIMEPNYFSHPNDVEIILEGIKHAINISRTPAFQAHGSVIHDVKVPGCEDWEFGTDDYWRCAIRHLPSMMHHEIGTVKMGPESDTGAVVDPQLRVYGVEGLRVIDASVMPTVPVGHTNAGIYMIGEKGADMIKQSWENVGY